MHVLLPPSEAKRTGGRGRSLAARAPHPTLGPARDQTLGALALLLERSAPDVAAALLLPPATVAAALAMNAMVATSATMPALRRYSGVVYDGLGYADMDEHSRRLAERRVLVFSGLFGIVRGGEAVPAYRVPAKAVLPGIGVAATFWRRTLERVIPVLLDRGLVVDLRSGDYAAMWRPPRELAARVITVRVLSPLPSAGTGSGATTFGAMGSGAMGSGAMGSGAMGVVSHPSKLAKGRLAAALIRRVAHGGAVTDVDHVAAAWVDCAGTRAEPDGANRLVVYTE